MLRLFIHSGLGLFYHFHQSFHVLKMLENKAILLLLLVSRLIVLRALRKDTLRGRMPSELFESTK